MNTHTPKGVTMNEYALGDKVIMSGVVQKTRTGNRTTYERAPLPVIGTSIKEGVIVGKRSMNTGQTPPHSPDEFPIFETDGVVDVWLVAYHMRRNPAMCLPDQVTLNA